MEVRQIEPIDRAELRATIQKWIDAHTDVDDTDGVGLLEDVLWEINAQPTLTPQNKWVSVDERLPDNKGEYLVAYHPCIWDFVSDEICVGFDSFRGKTTWAKKKYQRVTHWMPLPEAPDSLPPEGEKDTHEMP